MTPAPNPDDFPLHSTDKIRYRDTDRQGHVNNAIFSTLLETGRVELFYDSAAPLAEEGSAFVVARLAIDFRSELRWPGDILTGMRVASLGHSSVRLEQAIFQNGTCAATAEVVIVLIDEATRKSRPLSATARERLAALFPEAYGA